MMNFIRRLLYKRVPKHMTSYEQRMIERSASHLEERLKSARALAAMGKKHIFVSAAE